MIYVLIFPSFIVVIVTCVKKTHISATVFPKYPHFTKANSLSVRFVSLFRFTKTIIGYAVRRNEAKRNMFE